MQSHHACARSALGCIGNEIVTGIATEVRVIVYSFLVIATILSQRCLCDQQEQ